MCVDDGVSNHSPQSRQQTLRLQTLAVQYNDVAHARFAHRTQQGVLMVCLSLVACWPAPVSFCCARRPHTPSWHARRGCNNTSKRACGTVRAGGRGWATKHSKAGQASLKYQF